MVSVLLGLNSASLSHSGMSLFQSFFNLAVALMRSAGYGGIFALMFMESATLPVPSEVVLPLVGYLVYYGRFDITLSLLTSVTGSLLGTLVDYFLGYRLGRPVVLRYGRYIRLDERVLGAAERWFQNHGPVSVLLSRFVPLIRTVIAFPAGFAKMNVSIFLAFSTIGIIIWNFLLIYIGMAFATRIDQVLAYLYTVFGYAELVAALSVAGVLLYYVRIKIRFRQKR